MGLIESEKMGGVTLVTLNRPKALNALNRALLLELKAFLLQEEEQILVLTGSGEKSFVAGADIGEMEKMTPLEMLDFCDLGHSVMNLLESRKMPVIAAVNGYALGGGLELALACDFLYASETAKLGLPETTLGIIPGFGGTQRLADAVGKKTAREMIYRGKPIPAEEAHRIGLVNRLFAPDQLIAESLKTAEEIASRSPAAISAAKRVLLHGGLELEKQACALCFATEERKKAMTGFINKERPCN